jgi:hypothetical protein
MTAAVATSVSQFEDGVVAGLVQSNATVVGVQTQTTQPSQATWYHDQGLTYVSNIDQVEGQISLIYALVGRSTGRFGRGPHEQLLPGVS